jgi:ribosomal protein L27
MLTIIIIVLAIGICMRFDKRDVYVKLPDGRIQMYTVKEGDIIVENRGKTTWIGLPGTNGSIRVPTENVTIVTHGYKFNAGENHEIGKNQNP